MNNNHPYKSNNDFEIQHQKLTDLVNKTSNKQSDQEYFSHLVIYKPIFKSDESEPLFLQNQGWTKSMWCIIIFNVILAATLCMFLANCNDNCTSPGPNSSILPAQTPSNKQIMLISGIILLLLINLSYFFCQFLNPGIRNPLSISEEQFLIDGREFCQKCQQYKTKQMSHCRECNVCLWGLDHHCGFFGKCIAGYQKWAFYAFLTFLFLGFLFTIVMMGMAISF